MSSGPNGGSSNLLSVVQVSNSGSSGISHRNSKVGSINRSIGYQIVVQIGGSNSSKSNWSNGGPSNILISSSMVEQLANYM
ncbi:hypothetical protein DICPUDRAFT_154421 [Dictyostelium purpureum]|uniref:Uncharacterized protein n=1 Tax=Dictyostelium purpureum TaxID=5786 RepID=F0ZRA4_DICPU|nr:uncharacterized protein DICPUDRAFT_154421 [Dictyostelium purpureum]EGC33519.1 hypothetical protein DICPUDRAFT_154421 [Dictyostelium purpureum]|eukprot:XP_003289944.1 hypothetical protein DICPUDRAFT_154421 [Dictyostelium purpureum]